MNHLLYLFLLPLQPFEFTNLLRNHFGPKLIQSHLAFNLHYRCLNVCFHRLLFELAEVWVVIVGLVADFIVFFFAGGHSIVHLVEQLKLFRVLSEI